VRKNPAKVVEVATVSYNNWHCKTCSGGSGGTRVRRGVWPPRVHSRVISLRGWHPNENLFLRLNLYIGSTIIWKGGEGGSDDD